MNFTKISQLINIVLPILFIGSFLNACSTTDSRIRTPIEVRDYPLGANPESAGTQRVMGVGIEKPIISDTPPNKTKDGVNPATKTLSATGNALATTTTKNWPRVSRMSPTSANQTLMLSELGEAVNNKSIATVVSPAVPSAIDNPNDNQPEVNQSTDLENVAFSWPTKGRVLRPFNNNNLKGVELDGKVGDTVNAAADGKVIYTGSGLKGYGNLIVIKHSNDYVTVYGHNSKIFVKEGDKVNRGVKIAEMGNSDTDRPKLFFQIRKDKTSLDPQKVLPKR